MKLINSSKGTTMNKEFNNKMLLLTFFTFLLIITSGFVNANDALETSSSEDIVEESTSSEAIPIADENDLATTDLEE